MFYKELYEGNKQRISEFRTRKYIHSWDAKLAATCYQCYNITFVSIYITPDGHQISRFVSWRTSSTSEPKCWSYYYVYHTVPFALHTNCLQLFYFSNEILLVRVYILVCIYGLFILVYVWYKMDIKVLFFFILNWKCVF